MALTLGHRCSPVYLTRVRRPPQSGALVPDTSAHHPQNIGRWATHGRVVRPVRSRDERRDASHTEETRGGRPSSHVPIRADLYVIVGLCHIVSYEVNAFLLQYALNRLNILLILAGNANVTLDLAVTVLKNFELKRDTVQTENDVPAR